MIPQSTYAGAPPSAAEQLHHLDQIVAAHETYWTAVAQQNPHSAELRQFLHDAWDPWYSHWMLSRPQLGASDPATVASAVHEASQGLSQLRLQASSAGIPTPDLGTTQHGFVATQGEPPMSAYAGHAYAGAIDTQAIHQYRSAASAAVTRAAHQYPTTLIFGYFRTGIHEHVPLFSSLDEARAYQQIHPGYDYAAIFAASDLSTPIDEDFGASMPVSGDASVGHWALPLLLGLPAGALGGYYYRKWQESHPGKIIPFISGDAYAGNYPWVDILQRGYDYGPYAGSDYVGATAYAPGAALEAASRRALGPGPAINRASRRRGHALIESATSEVLGEDSGAGAYVWYLDPMGGTSTIPFSSYPEALDYNRGLIQQDALVAVAVFDRSSPHWPNPVGWHTSGDPSYEGVIAAQIAKHHAPPVAGQWVDMVGNAPWVDLVGQSAHEVTMAIDTLRTQARETAKEKPGRFVGVAMRGENRFDPRAWEVKTFRSTDMAENWYERVTGDPRSFLYAAYYDMQGPMAPVQLAEGVGGSLQASATA